MLLFSILVNTTDSFEDCWIPFFTLFKKYWSDYNGAIYLNTETKSFSFDGLNIVSVQNNLKTPNYRPTWSECLLHALDAIPDSIVLYMQEDYFLHDSVKSSLVNEFARLLSTTDIDCIHLTDQATPGPFRQTSYKQLLEIDKNASYRISTQAALWKKDVLKQYIRKHESAWQFEHYATKRASILKHNLFNVNTNTYIKGQNEIIPYIFTGIIKGMWNTEMVKISEKEELIIGFDKRGFLNPAYRRSIIDMICLLFNYCHNLRSEIGIFILKVKSFSNHK